jgi:hypothetical protein
MSAHIAQLLREKIRNIQDFGLKNFICNLQIAMRDIVGLVQRVVLFLKRNDQRIVHSSLKAQRLLD